MTDHLVDTGAGAPGAVWPSAVRAPSLRVSRLVIAATALITCLAFAPSALAAPHHSFTQSFGASGTGGSQFGTGSPTGAAINQTTGDVYVADTANSRVERFQADGTFVSAFGWGVDDGTAVAQVCTSGCEAGIPGAGAGQLATPAFVAIDNSAGPSAGDVYVADTTNNTVSRFDASGNVISSNSGLTTTTGAFGALAGVAVNASGDLWVYDQNAEMFKFAQDGSFLTEFNTTFGVTPAGIAVDPAGSLYIVRGTPYVEKVSDTGTDLGQVTDDAGATGVAIDPVTGELYVGQGTTVERFGATCDPSAGTCAVAETFGSPDVTAGSGIAVRSINSRVYVADPGNTQVDMFDSLDIPAVVTGSASAVTATTATVNGSVDPDSNSVSDCHFDYVTDVTFQSSGFTTAATAPCVPDPGSGPDPVLVAAQLGSLAAGTTYHFRLVASNANGTANGGGLQFTTDAFAVTDSATKVHHTNAVLNGHLDPREDPAITGCSFDWGTDTTYGHSADCDQGDSFAAPAAVSAFINDLTPGAVYHFRLHLSTTSHGETTGADQSFVAPTFTFEAQQVAVFGPNGTDATSFSAAGSGGFFPLALRQSDRKLFGFDLAVPGIFGFDASGPPAYPNLTGFSPLATAPTGLAPGLAVDNTALASAGNLYLVSEQQTKVYGFDSTGAPLGGNFPISPGADPGNPDICGAGVDSSGSLWVGDYANFKIREYDSFGVSLGSIDTSGQGHPCNVAFDSANNLYVDLFQGAVWRYSASSGYAPGSATEIDAGDGRAIAIDPSTDVLYVAHPAKVSQYDAAGALIGEFAPDIAGADFEGIAVDATNHSTYVADAANGKVHVFAPGAAVKAPAITPGDPTATTATTATLNAKVDPETFAVTDCRFDYGTDDSYGHSAPCVPDPGSGSGDVSVHADLTGLEPGTTYHFRIQASNANTNGTASGPDQTLATDGPAIHETHAAPVTDTTATLNALVNPRGHQTTFHFDYGTDTSYGASTPESDPIGTSSTDHAISADLGGLAPATTYHFRAVATNALGTGHGPDATFTTSGTPDACPNASLRTGYGHALPDCRAYEQASPTDKHGVDLAGAQNDVQASSDGDRITFLNFTGLPTSGGSTGNAPFVASRGASAWSTNGLLPLVDSGAFATILGWDGDLRTSLSTVDSGSEHTITIGDLANGTWSEEFSSPNNLGTANVADFASDPSHFIFEATAALAPGAVPGAPNLYEFDNGNLSLAGRVPDVAATTCDDAGGPPCVPAAAGSFAGTYDWANSLDPQGLNDGGALDAYYTRGTLSSNGSMVFFTGAGTGRLYMREDGTRTTELSASQASTPDPNGHKPAAWVGSTPNGEKIFFLSCEKLTDDSTAVSTSSDSCVEADQGQDLYSYDTSSGQLTDLAVDSDGGDALGAAVGGFLGASADGSEAYFVGDGVLAPGAAPGDCANVSFAGACNLYRSHDGSVSLVAELGADRDSIDWRPYFPKNIVDPVGNTARVSADGTLVFASDRQLTAYDNGGNSEIYRYAPGAPGPVCVSCHPAGAPPVGSAKLEVDHSRLAPSFQTISTRNLSVTGDRVYFQTEDPLVARDTNGVTDPYEWEAQGSGLCRSQTENGGCIYILSSGTSPDPSYFADASASGDDVFIFTRDPLVPQDTDQLVDVYDVRTGGGLSSQHPASPAVCSSDACQGLPSAPPVLPVAGSVTFAGAGNAPSRPGVPATAKPKVSLLRTIRGSSGVLSVKVPSRGRLTVSGTGLRRASAVAAKAGTYKLKVALSAKARRTWRKAHVLRVRAKVVFAPSNGAPATATVTLTFRTATTKKKGR